ncbi:MAG: aminotransferase class I/II-fold pyridoxal phosphate-dependent enzyme [Gammaproteobacteria bacterium]|nr:aminotransferase class I/II-fold pyridoxal phosphate-dependent enzyme [Gammaproteobacteria bacterium]
MGRLGTESAFEVLARANALAAEGRDIINLGIGQPDFRTPDHVVEAARQALLDGHHGYTPSNGIPELRQAVAADVNARHGVDIDPRCVVIVPGAKVTMAMAMLMFGEAGAEIMYPDPGFPIYESMIRYSGAKPVPIRLYEESGFSFSAAEVLEGITGKTRLIILNSPANPTGGVVPKSQIDRLVEGLHAHPHVALMSDEIYSRMTYDGLEHVTLLAYPELRDRLIVLDGWSKTYAMTGWRVGWGLWPQSLAEQAVRLCINIHSCVNAPTQFAAITALQGPQDDVDKMVSAFDERRELITQQLNGIAGFSCVRPRGAFYAFPNITASGFDARTLQDRLLAEAGVAVIAGTSFGAQGEGYLRFSYANSLANIAAAMERIRDWMAHNS